MKSVTTAQGRIVKLERGEELVATLTAWCAAEGLKNAVFTGIGAVEHVEIGYYDLPTKTYVFKKEDAVFEVASMQGNVALVEGKEFIHVHAVLSRCDDSLACIAAHIKSAIVAVTLEIFVTVLDSTIERKLDDSIGLKLLDL